MDAPTSKPAQKRRRQRSPSPPAPRKKSCEACRKAKARCNTALPACSRCSRKGIACDYGGTRNEEQLNVDALEGQVIDADPDAAMTISAADFEAVSLMLEDADAPFSLQPFRPVHIVNATPLTGSGTPLLGQVAGHQQQQQQQQQHQQTQQQLGGFDGTPFEGYSTGASQSSPENSLHGSNSGAESGPGYQTGDSSQSPEESHGRYAQELFIDPNLEVHGTAPPPLHSDPQNGVRPLPFHMITTYRDDGSKQVEIYPNENGEEYNPRFFGFNNNWSPPACTLSANRVIGSFKIWPKRMVRGDDLPPFIHPHFPAMRVSSIAAMTKRPLGRQYFGQPPKLPETLANCSSICTMFYNKTPENAAFVWKNIKREQERIYASYKSWDSRQCLSAYQAMIIYSFCRIIDGETEHNNFDMAFILTIGEISAGLWSNQMREIQERTADPADISWQDWMLAESACRTGIVFMFMFIMMGLYKVIPPTQGCRGLDGMPLPCGRKLWNARDQEEWEREYRAYRSSRKSQRPITFADLSCMRDDTGVSLPADIRADIEAWATDLDEFGNLVLIGGLGGPGSQLEDYRRNHLYVVDDNVA